MWCNGITYSNSCFADCDGVTYSEGACDDQPVDCEYETFTLNMSDSYGDGWNGNTFEVAGQTVTLDSGSEGSASVCIDMSSCNTITVGGIHGKKKYHGHLENYREELLMMVR